ncbi:hypothetical protein RB653_000807 [Dictyostelium firmibasis]|uniref:Uncharacterized protein n=1 Tax=Dictyostelium firmibasis TaxID=79012 RepID=A0AAN7U6F4_9MYCE
MFKYEMREAVGCVNNTDSGIQNLFLKDLVYCKVVGVLWMISFTYHYVALKTRIRHESQHNARWINIFCKLFNEDERKPAPLFDPIIIQKEISNPIKLEKFKVMKKIEPNENLNNNNNNNNNNNINLLNQTQQFLAKSNKSNSNSIIETTLKLQHRR